MKACLSPSEMPSYVKMIGSLASDQASHRVSDFVDQYQVATYLEDKSEDNQNY